MVSEKRLDAPFGDRDSLHSGISVRRKAEEGRDEPGTGDACLEHARESSTTPPAGCTRRGASTRVDLRATFVGELCSPANRHFVDGVSCVLDGHAMRVANLSVGGLFAATELRPPDLGTARRSWSCAFPSAIPFRVVGEVTWINEPRNPADLPPGFGVQITQIESGDKEALQTLLLHSDPILSISPRGH